MKIHKLLRMTYNDICEFFDFMPAPEEENGVASPK